MQWPNQFTDLPIRRHPDLMLAKELFESGDRSKAFAVCSEFLDRYPDAVLPHITRALIYIGRKQLDEAEQEVNSALAKRNDWATVWGLAGIVAREQANYQHAREYFQKASEFAQSSEERSDYLFWLADVNGALKDYETAIANLKESYRLHPCFTKAWALVMMFLTENKLLLVGFLAVGVYSTIFLPPMLAIAPCMLLVVFLLLTAIYFVKTNRAQQAAFFVGMATVSIFVLYFRTQ